ncbi:MAG: hypothetical protein K6G64_01305 [Eubacterium sp.]|nr:hypothetical protein [Eubacterium sp.]
MSGLMNELKKRQENTEKVMKKMEQMISLNGMDEQKINVVLRQKGIQFYKKNQSGEYRYIPKTKKEEAIKILQQQYYKKIYESTTKEMRLLGKLQTFLEQQAAETIYQNLGKGKQKVVIPIVVPKEQFIEAWLSEEYTGKPFPENSPEYYTDRGERVRSKSEKIIADKLYREEIHYRYEYPLELPGWGVVYPDFTILDVENRRNIIYEHFGMMDDENYAGNAIAKVQRYASAGYYIGDNFFITMESSRNPLDSRTLDGIVQQLKS